MIGRHSDSGWQAYWIGHPQLPVRRAEEWLELSVPNDHRSPEPAWRVRPAELQSAVLDAHAELERFAPRVLQVLKTWSGLKRIETLARNLAGLGED